MRLINRRGKQSGFTLVETLVAMVLIAIGLIGNAGAMMMISKKNNESYLRSQATMLAFDILERIRVNKVSAKAGHFSHSFGAGNSTDTTIGGTEVNDWLTNIGNALPLGDGAVTVDSSGKATISLRWKETSISGDRTFVTESYI